MLQSRTARWPAARPWRAAALLLATAALLRNAWICDDAFITLRTVDNFLHGFGLTWNPYERVQSFTHPLWLAVLTVADLLTSSGYWAVMLASLAFAVAAVILALGRPPAAAAPILTVGVVLALSRAFVDYGTAGLENPLAYLLCALAIRADFAPASDDARRRLFRLSILASLLALTRLDLALLILPALAARAIPGLRRYWRSMLVSAAPLIAWEVFAVIYYGFPLPNTAYAKLGAGVSAGDLVRQGMWYLEATVRSDPLTAIVIVGGLSWVLVRGDRQRRLWAMGVTLYLLYVVRIGGDFMMGRFLAVPFFVVVVLVGDRLPAGRRGWILVAARSTGLIVPGTRSYRRRPAPGQPWFHGVSDERAFYAPQTGLWARLRRRFPGTQVRDRRTSRRAGSPNSAARRRMSPAASDSTDIMPGRTCASSMSWPLPIRSWPGCRCRRADDPGSWRIGHFKRELPAGYTETVSSTVNQLQDPHLAALYRGIPAGDHRSAVQPGPLARHRAI